MAMVLIQIGLMNYWEALKSQTVYLNWAQGRTQEVHRTIGNLESSQLFIICVDDNMEVIVTLGLSMAGQRMLPPSSGYLFRHSTSYLASVQEKGPALESIWNESKKIFLQIYPSAIFHAEFYLKRQIWESV